jgi:hypothetical protein
MVDQNGLLGDIPPSINAAKQGAATTPKASAEKPAATNAPASEPTNPPAPPDPTQPAPPQSQESARLMRVRVLLKCPFGKPNDVVELGEEAVVAAERAGFVCSHEASVAYADSLKR